MELRDYVKIIGKHLWLVVCIGLLIALGAYLFSITRSVSFDGSVSMYVGKPSGKLEVKDYQYDEYYALQASSLYADSVISWLKEPSNVVKIYDNAKLDLPTEKISKLSKTIAALKQNPATISITAHADNESSVNNLLDATVKFVNLKNSSLNQNPQDNFTISASDISVFQNKPNVLLNSLIGLAVGLMIGLGFVFLVDYFQIKK